MADNRTMAQMLQAPIEGESRDWLDKEPPRSILTWDDLVSKFINQYFPPSKTTYYRNEIITFYQKPNEAFNEAWERFKGLLRQYALDSAEVGRIFLRERCSKKVIAIIESKSKNKVPEKLEDPGKFLIPCALQNSKGLECPLHLSSSPVKPLKIPARNNVELRIILLVLCQCLMKFQLPRKFSSKFVIGPSPYADSEDEVMSILTLDLQEMIVNSSTLHGT
ncbi:reverse transcriptase domain-containing protein [Tanacetum coccineum]